MALAIVLNSAHDIDFLMTYKYLHWNMDDLTLTEVIIACELKWRYRDVVESRFMQIFGSYVVTLLVSLAGQ